MKILFRVKGKKALRATVVVKQDVFDDIKSSGFLQLEDGRYWYTASSERMIRTIVNSLLNKALKDSHA